MLIYKILLMEASHLKKISQEKSENDWIFCFIREGAFQGACGPLNLIEVLEIFHDWVESIHAR